MKEDTMITIEILDETKLKQMENYLRKYIDGIVKISYSTFQYYNKRIGGPGYEIRLRMFAPSDEETKFFTEKLAKVLRTEFGFRRMHKYHGCIKVPYKQMEQIYLIMKLKQLI
jgi:hypothetical protein